MKKVLYLRVLGLLANAIYIAYGIMIDAPPVYIGCTIAVLVHSYRIYKTKGKVADEKSGNNRKPDNFPHTVQN